MIGINDPSQTKENKAESADKGEMDGIDEMQSLKFKTIRYLGLYTNQAVLSLVFMGFHKLRCTIINAHSFFCKVSNPRKYKYGTAYLLHKYL